GSGRYGCAWWCPWTRGRRPGAAAGRPGTPRATSSRHGPGRPALPRTRRWWASSAPGSGRRSSTASRLSARSPAVSPWWRCSRVTRFRCWCGWVEVDAEQGVVVRQRPQHDGVAVGVLTGGCLTALTVDGQGLAHLRGGGLVLGIGDDAVLGPRACVAGGELAVADHRHLAQ